MRKFQEKSGFRKIVESRPVLLILFVILLLFAWNIFTFLDKGREAKRNLDIANNKLTELENNKKKLENDLKALDSVDGIEASIRNKYGLVKEGEEVVIVVDDKNAPIEVPEKETVFTKIKNWFR